MAHKQSTAQPSVRIPLNDWYKYIHKATENTVRPGGVAHTQGQQSALNTALNILKND